MIWLGLLWIGFGVVDAAHAVSHGRWWPSVAGTVAVLVVSGLAGVFSGVVGGLGWAISVAIAAVVLGWGAVVRTGFGRAVPGLPLAYAVLASLVMIGLSPVSGGGGLLEEWLAASDIGYLREMTADRWVLLAGAVALQGSTGNVLVRLALMATHTIRPDRSQAPEPGPRLKGGRLLGPMERLIILGLGLTGSYTAIGIIVAAKGLLRFPELQAARDAIEGPSIAEVTEYFLVGNFLSWSLALGTLAVVVA